jgi:hypothetical protein
MLSIPVSDGGSALVVNEKFPRRFNAAPELTRSQPAARFQIRSVTSIVVFASSGIAQRDQDTAETKAAQHPTGHDPADALGDNIDALAGRYPARRIAEDGAKVSLPVPLGHLGLWEKLRPNAIAIRMQPTAPECPVLRTKV